ncbi:phage tail length tape measure family protein [Clostridium sp. Mt-5]|uniref:Phage tail length tape measure family protein n=2 Tax=Clostridium moutaii TaxID=3240932 RepID=A0ABV4BXP8_9CLOT
MAKQISTVLNLVNHWSNPMEACARSTLGFSKITEKATAITKALDKDGTRAVRNYADQMSHLHNQVKTFGSGITGTFKNMASSAISFGLGLAGGLSLKTMVANAQAAQKATAQMSAVLKSTGGAAGLTQKQLLDLAAAQSRVTTYSKGTVIGAENLLLTFTKIGKQTFPDTIRAAENMSTKMGTNLNSNVMQLGKALNSPADGLSKLTRAGVTFSDSQKKMIKSMQTAGNTVGAQKLMLQELNKEFGGSAEAAAKTIPGQLAIIKNTFSGLGSVIMTTTIPYFYKLTSWLGEEIPKGVSVAQKYLPSISKTLANIVKQSSPIVGGIIKDIGSIASQLIPKFGTSTQGLGKTITTLVTGPLYGLRDILDYLKNHIGLVRIALITLIGTFATFKVVGAINSMSKLVRSFMDARRAISIAQKAIGGLKFNPANFQAMAIVGGIALIAGAAYLIIKNWIPIKQFFSNTFTSIKNTINSAYNTINSKINDFLGVLKNHQAAIRNTAIILGTIFGPALIKSGTQAAIAGGKIAGSFIANTIKAGTQAAIAGGKVAISFTGNLIKSGVQAVIAAGKITGSFIASMAKAGLQAGITGAKIMGSLVKSIVSYAAAGWRAVGSIAAFTGGIVKQGAIAAINAARIVILKTATLAVSAAQKIATGTQAALNFVMNMNPLVRIVTIIFSLVGALVVLYNKNVWFREKVNAVFTWFSTLPTKFKTWAHDMVQGFVQGIEDKIEGIKKGAQHIADTIHKILHFSKPDEGPLTTYGQWMPDFVNGMSTGIVNTTPNILKSTTGMTTGMANTVQSYVNTCRPTGMNVVSELAAGIGNSEAQSNILSVVKTLTAKIIDAFKTGFGIHSPSRVFFKLGNYIVQGFVNGLNSKDMGGFIKNWIGSMTSSAGSASGNVANWLTAAMAITGTPMSFLPMLENIAMNESGGNPTAINLWDSNAKAGHPSKGLMQMIDSSFNRYAIQGLGNIYNPIANAAASIRYMIGTYGSISNVPGIVSQLRGGGYKGYALGTSSASPGVAQVAENGMELIVGRQFRRFQGGEKVLNNTQTKAILGDNGNPQISVFVTVQGNMIGNKEYAEEMGEYIGNKVLIELNNM